ncbi:MAG: acyltransferase [Alphaproteobacteria bacterium]|nr:acyltransferase [Alphaproteobacteria bacterium]
MNTPSRIKPLDGLRAFAIFLVILYHGLINVENIEWVLNHQAHFDIKHIIFSGWVGVDLFFVLSGFLIGSKLLTNYINISYLKTFIIKRFFRIAPAYYFCVCLTLLRLHLLPAIFKGTFLQTLQLYSLPFLAHIIFLQDYVWSEPHIDWVFWSIPIEMKFYLILPFIILTMNKIQTPEAKTLILVASYIIYVIARTINIDMIFEGQSVTLFYFSNNVRLPFHLSLDGLWIGVICAYYSQTRHFEDLGNKTLNIVFCAGLVLFFLCTAYLSAFTQSDILLSDFEQKYKIPLVNLAFGLILISSVKGCFASNFLSSKVLWFIAKISYSLYLTHAFGMMLNEVLIKTLFQHFESYMLCWLIALPIYLGFCLIPAYLLHELVEMPCINYAKQKFAKKETAS